MATTTRRTSEYSASSYHSLGIRPPSCGAWVDFTGIRGPASVVLLAITKLIIDGIVQARTLHQPVQPRFWWLVAGEFGVAILGSVLSRIIDYLDSLLADNYTRHVSIQVMTHAAELDLQTYEDPVFYDRLDRARGASH